MKKVRCYVSVLQCAGNKEWRVVCGSWCVRCAYRRMQLSNIHVVLFFLECMENVGLSIRKWRGRGRGSCEGVLESVMSYT